MKRFDEIEPVKSVGNSITFARDLCGEHDIRTGLTMLCDSVAARLRQQGLYCTTIQVQIKDPFLKTIQRQSRVSPATNTTKAVFDTAMGIVRNAWPMTAPIRLLGVSASGLTEHATEQLTLLDDAPQQRERDVKSEQFDLFICQLSTNDTTKRKPLGKIANSWNLEDFDTSTITGAMEYIICYAQETWDCPVVFFTGSHYDSEAYGAMVARLLELQEKWGIGVLDLWSSDEFNDIFDEQRAIYMNDGIHPTRAGYRDWWGPEQERQLLTFLNS